MTTLYYSDIAPYLVIPVTTRTVTGNRVQNLLQIVAIVNCSMKYLFFVKSNVLNGLRKLSKITALRRICYRQFSKKKKNFAPIPRIYKSMELS
jgi:hypothetical protein